MRRQQYFLSVGLAVFAASAWMSITHSVVAAAPVPAQEASPAAGSVKDGVFTAEQAERGRTTFQNVCSACHTVAEHTGGNFQSKWDGTSIGDAYDLISSIMPDGNPGSLKPQEYIDVIAFFLKETGYPEGKAELPPDSAKLKNVKIEPLP